MTVAEYIESLDAREAVLRRMLSEAASDEERAGLERRLAELARERVELAYYLGDETPMELWEHAARVLCVLLLAAAFGALCVVYIPPFFGVEAVPLEGFVSLSPEVRAAVYWIPGCGIFLPIFPLSLVGIALLSVLVLRLLGRRSKEFAENHPGARDALVFLLLALLPVCFILAAGSLAYVVDLHM